LATLECAPHTQKMNRLAQMLCVGKGLRHWRVAGVRFYAQAGYGNSCNVSENPSDTGKYDQDTKAEAADVVVTTTQENVTESKSGKKASPEVKAARKKLREGDQDAVRDYTAGID